MANNRMYLVNTKTNEMICLGKYSPSTGWYLEGADSLVDRINKALHQADFGDIHYSEAKEIGLMAKGGLFGDTSWTIQYETVADVADDESAQLKVNMLKAVSGQ